VPASAWADPEIRAYVPSRYAVCYFMETGDANPGSINDGYEYPSTVAAHFGVLGFFPARVQDILRGKDHTYSGSPGPLECSEVTTEEARALAAILRGVRVEDSEGDRISWEFHALLPHGEWVETGG
jgi:hypothetical protein